MKGPLVFLGRFVLASSLLYGAWSLLGEYYLAGLTPLTNLLFRMQHLPVQLDHRGGILLLAYCQPGAGLLRLQALDYHVVYLNLIAAVSLVLATPGQGLRWRLRWTAGLAGALCATHVASFYAGAYIALWDYLGSLTDTLGRDALVAAYGVSFPSATAQLGRRILGIWNLWGRHGLVLAAWFVAERGWIVPQPGCFPAPAIGPLEAVWARLKSALQKPAAGPQDLELNPII